jgi:FkbM family methyltransferase
MSSNGELRLQRLVVGLQRARHELTAFDVGARVGDWSRAFAQVAAGGAGGFKLHAFEPVPDSNRQLSEALAPWIQAGSVRVNELALSDAAAVVPIYVPHYTGGTSTLHPDATTEYSQVIDIATSTIDQYCLDHDIAYIDIVKIDTEGNDFRVLNGAQALLRGGKAGVVQFEYNHRWILSRAYLKDVFDLIKDSPYRLAKVCSSSLDIYAEWHPELERFFETNYALVHEQLVAPLGCQWFRIGSGNACERVPAQGAQALA